VTPAGGGKILAECLRSPLALYDGVIE
jgi:hypothetical protein